MHHNNNILTGWFGGPGGGSSPWESVEAHWNYMRSPKTNSNGPRTIEISQSQVGIGDVLQYDHDYDGIYDHAAICVGTNPLIFAQHTYDYDNHPISNYIGPKRFYRPTSFREY